MRSQPEKTLQLDLRQPLPADLVAGLTCWPLRYRRFPVFGWRWWRGRFLTSLIFILAYAALGLVGFLAKGEPLEKVLTSWGYFVVGGLLMVNFGPALASWLRSSSAPAVPRGWIMIGAAMLGFTGALSVDAWASSGVERSMDRKPIPESERKISKVDEAALRLFKLGGAFLYFALGGGLATLAYFSEQRRLRARSALLQQLASDMRLSVLQAQLEPHFLFNTLAAIRPMLRQDATKAEAALDALTNHLRAVMPQIRLQTDGVNSTLGQQLDICRSYLDVMQLRMGDRLTIQVQMEEKLREHPFPPMMLVSLVENAIKHGLEPKPGPGTLRLSAVVSGPQLVVKVEDDGLGLTSGLTGGVGLANIREQLQLRYGDQASLEVAGRASAGTVSTIAVPHQPTPP